MAKETDIKQRSDHSTSGHLSQLRFTCGSGGPGEMEVLVHSDENRVQIAVWNPWRNEWATVDLQGQGDQEPNNRHYRMGPKQ